ncbi:hypothetical protein F5B21DRAFT_506306 [Xylaria acuta]|nr:hypothetical protein F5B21DRAFT_506306 [Xylaria acuta]
MSPISQYKSEIIDISSSQTLIFEPIGTCPEFVSSSSEPDRVNIWNINEVQQGPRRRNLYLKPRSPTFDIEINDSQVHTGGLKRIEYTPQEKLVLRHEGPTECKIELVQVPLYLSLTASEGAPSNSPIPVHGFLTTAILAKGWKADKHMPSQYQKKVVAKEALLILWERSDPVSRWITLKVQDTEDHKSDTIWRHAKLTTEPVDEVLKKSTGTFTLFVAHYQKAAQLNISLFDNEEARRGKHI